MWYAEAKKIYILPMGKISGPVTEAVSVALAGTFGKETVVRDEIPLPIYAYDRFRQQCNSTRILEEFSTLDLDGMVLGIVDVDLYVPGLDFVFGEADAENGLAVVSITRLKEDAPDGGVFLSRVIKEAVHETGHLYGLRHCPDEKCVMFYSNCLEDTDRKSDKLCPADRDTIGI